jgi:hypothetical protein
LDTRVFSVGGLVVTIDEPVVSVVAMMDLFGLPTAFQDGKTREVIGFVKI